jgi:thymidylate kinase
LIHDITNHVGNEIASALLKWFEDPYPEFKPDIIYYFPTKIGNRQDDDFDLFDKASKEFSDRVENAYNMMYTKGVHSSYIPKWIKVINGNSPEETLENLINEN